MNVVDELAAVEGDDTFVRDEADFDVVDAAFELMKRQVGLNSTK